MKTKLFLLGTLIFLGLAACTSEEPLTPSLDSKSNFTTGNHVSVTEALQRAENWIILQTANQNLY